MVQDTVRSISCCGIHQAKIMNKRSSIIYKKLEKIFIEDNAAYVVLNCNLQMLGAFSPEMYSHPTPKPQDLGPNRAVVIP